MDIKIYGQTVAAPARARLILSRERLLHNYRTLCERAGKAEVIAVVKANAYGHGAPAVAKILYSAGCRRFAVCDLGEALALRDALPSPNAEILVLGHTPKDGARLAAAYGIRLTVHTAAEGYAYASALGDSARLSVEVKLNSGMNRTGFSLLPSDQTATLSAVLCLAAHPALRLCGIYSHLASADTWESGQNACQLTRFRAALAALSARGVRAPAHIAASAAALRAGACGFPLLRAGLALYGYDPCGENDALLPVARLVAPITQILPLPPGEPVGYAAAFRSKRKERIGTIALGYADGLLRSATGAYVRVGGLRVPIVGRISMDSAALCLSDLAPNAPCREAVVFGDTAGDLYALARTAGSIPYEILAGLGPRIERIYQ